jgi:hypothetical protein
MLRLEASGQFSAALALAASSGPVSPSGAVSRALLPSLVRILDSAWVEACSVSGQEESNPLRDARAQRAAVQAAKVPLLFRSGCSALKCAGCCDYRLAGSLSHRMSRSV